MINCAGLADFSSESDISENHGFSASESSWERRVELAFYRATSVLIDASAAGHAARDQLSDPGTRKFSANQSPHDVNVQKKNLCQFGRGFHLDYFLIDGSPHDSTTGWYR